MKLIRIFANSVCIAAFATASSSIAQPTPAISQSNATVADPAVGRAPDEATAKITDLVHAGKYAEAQKLTEGLLIAYPNDQRLIKARALIEKLLAPGGSASAAPGSAQPPQPAANADAEQLTGMDVVDDDALVELARQAQQTHDLDEQTKLLRQFMDRSSVFLQKHPGQMLLWQFRIVSAIRLNDPMAGYEAGQRLLAAGITDSTDANSRRLLAQLKNLGWLDRQAAEDAAKYSWILGKWSNHWALLGNEGDASEEFVKSGSVIAGYQLAGDGSRYPRTNLRGVILDSGEIRWEYTSGDLLSVPASCAISNDKRTVTIAFTEVQDTAEQVDQATKKITQQATHESYGVTWTLRRK
jgi:hypothetical protein